MCFLENAGRCQGRGKTRVRLCAGANWYSSEVGPQCENSVWDAFPKRVGCSAFLLSLSESFKETSLSLNQSSVGLSLFSVHKFHSFVIDLFFCCGCLFLLLFPLLRCLYI